MKNPEHQAWPDGTRVRFTDRAKASMRDLSALAAPLDTPANGADAIYTIDNTDDSFSDVILRETGERYGVAWLTKVESPVYKPRFMLDEIGNLDPFTPEQLREMLSIGLDRTDDPAVEQATSPGPVLQNVGQLREAFPDIDDALQTIGDEDIVFRMPPNIPTEALNPFVEANEPERPTVVCLCGSTRLPQSRAEFDHVNRRLTLTGSIVLAPTVFTYDGDQITMAQELELAELHLRKIDLADEVLVLDTDRYVGELTEREIAYARKQRKPVYFLSTLEPLAKENIASIRDGDRLRSSVPDAGRVNEDVGQNQG